MRRRFGRIVRLVGAGMLVAAGTVYAYTRGAGAGAILALGVGVAMIGHWMTGFGRIR